MVICIFVKNWASSCGVRHVISCFYLLEDTEWQVGLEVMQNS